MDRRRFLAIVLTASALPVGACVREKPVTPAPSGPRPTGASGTYTLHDLAGRPRNPRNGITPGALEVDDELHRPSPMPQSDDGDNNS